MITVQTLKPVLERIAIECKKTMPTISDIDNALSSKNQTSVIQSWRNRLEIEIWDGNSDVNTANAQYIRENNPWIDVAYILKIDGVVTYFQTHLPFEEGYVPITLETVDAVSNAHADSIATDAGHSQIFQKILVELGLSDPAKEISALG